MTKAFLKPLRTFLIYNLFVTVLCCAIIIIDRHVQSFMYFASLACYLSVLNPCLVGIISCRMQKKYSISVKQTMLSSIIVFILTLGNCFIAPSTFLSKDVETILGWSIPAFEATLIFVLTALITKHSKK